MNVTKLYEARLKLLKVFLTYFIFTMVTLLKLRAKIPEVITIQVNESLAPFLNCSNIGQGGLFKYP